METVTDFILLGSKITADIDCSHEIKTLAPCKKIYGKPSAHVLSCFSCVQLCITLWTVTHQAPLFIGFSRQEYWSRLLCPLPGDLPNPGIRPVPLMSYVKGESEKLDLKLNIPEAKIMTSDPNTL